jgi:hypothetical protein
MKEDMVLSSHIWSLGVHYVYNPIVIRKLSSVQESRHPAGKAKKDASHLFINADFCPVIRSRHGAVFSHLVPRRPLCL